MTSTQLHVPAILGIIATFGAFSSFGCSSSSDDSDDGKKMSSTSAGNGNSAGSGSSSAGNSSSGGSNGSSAGSGSSDAGSGSSKAGSGNSTAGSGSGGGAPSGCGPAPADCSAAAALKSMPISDFEAGKGWYLFANPDDAAGKTEPAAGDNISAAEITCPSGGRCGSSFAQHVSGSGFTSYGPSLSQDFLYKDGETAMVVGMPIDASDYTGVMFWARKGDTAGATPTLRLIVNDETTHELGGICDPKAAPGAGGKASDACWDGWMTERAMASTWTLVKVPFSVLKQGGFGKKGEAIKADKLYGLTFQMPNMAKFDFWIDDVSFYKE